ncbi:Uncharacterised protein [Streptococcus pneumoniae]|nr:Uncharacterised protein [Streptococcus pneumoniae]
MVFRFGVNNWGTVKLRKFTIITNHMKKATKTMPSCILSVSKLNYSSTKNYDEEHINL